MTISIELLATLISVIILVVGFIISRNKESERRGRLLQRIDTLENTLNEIRDKNNIITEKVNCHDGDIRIVTNNIESLRELVITMNEKLDRLMEIK